MEDEVFDIVVKRLSVEIIGKANKTQIAIDTWLESQALTMAEEQIVDLIESGVSTTIKAELQSFTSSAERFLSELITNAGQEGIHLWLDENANGEDLYTWTTNSTRTCPDCANLSGETHPYSYWTDVMFLPQTGGTLCNTKCRCQLIKANK